MVRFKYQYSHSINQLVNGLNTSLTIIEIIINLSRFMATECVDDKLMKLEWTELGRNDLLLSGPNRRVWIIEV